jgi:hypothetical protein
VVELCCKVTIGYNPSSAARGGQGGFLSQILTPRASSYPMPYMYGSKSALRRPTVFAIVLAPLTPLTPWPCRPQALFDDIISSYYVEGCMRDYTIRCFPLAPGSRPSSAARTRPRS